MGLFLFYWVEKYLYSHAYARPANLGVDLNRAMIEMLEYFPFFLAIGTMIFNYVF